MVIDKIKRRLAGEDGYTLIELLVVSQILSILVAIAVPAYLGFRINAAKGAAQANVHSAVTAASSWYADSAGGNGTYTGLSGANLRLETPGIDPNAKAGPNSTSNGFCLEDVVGGQAYSYTGGAGGTNTILAGICAAGTYPNVL
ncbi:MAG TPA: prepilin-type N-terminal cleavage/methylation domain-containing protein [Gaiellaceae bacterium]|nr:prepilin-type N-terminal cleavage/methylation domain-containing protein [Gaiellaceae bacterium]